MANASFNFPSDVSVDPFGNLYILDQSTEIKAMLDGTVRKISAEGIVSTLAGTTAGYVDGPGNVAKFYTLQGLAINSYGLLVTGDSRNSAIRIINTQSYRLNPYCS